MDSHFDLELVVEDGGGPFRPGGPLSLGGSTFFAGCNIYHTRSVTRQSVSFTAELEKDVRMASPEFMKAFQRRFLDLPRFAPTHGQKKDIKDLISSSQRIGLDQILLEAIVAVETATALTLRDFNPIRFAVVDQHPEHVDLIWETTSPRLSRRVAEVACIGVLELLREQDTMSGGRQSEFEASLNALFETARQTRPTLTASLVKYVAQQRGLPVKLLSREQLRIGQGRMQRHMESSMTDATSAVTHKMCWDKRMANRRMVELRLPVPMHAKVTSAEAARQAAKKLGFPVVVKPVKGSGGQGVTSKITTHEEVEAAYFRAVRPASDVLVEEFVPGFLHRLLVIGGKLAGAILCRQPMIVGDGRKTVQQLIDELNADPLRNGMIMGTVDYDDEVERLLNKESLTLESVMAEGARCPLRLVANIGMGASSYDCTDLVHEDNRELAERATKGFFLDVAGIDVISPDISRSYREVGGGIIEVNSKPGLLIHMWPAQGTSRNFAAKILERLYPAGEDGRIPIVVVAGDRGTGTAARLLDQLLRGCGKSTGLSLREAAYINGKTFNLKLDEKRVTPATLLADPEVEVLVSAVSLRRIVQRGLELDSCAVAIILDPNEKGDADQFQAGVSVVERATAEAFVVGVGNQIALQHFQALGKRKLILVGNRITDPLAQQHLARGGTVIADGWTDEDDPIVLMKGERQIAHFPANKAWARLTKGQQRKMRRVTKLQLLPHSGSAFPSPRSRRRWQTHASLEHVRGAPPPGQDCPAKQYACCRAFLPH